MSETIRTNTSLDEQAPKPLFGKDFLLTWEHSEAHIRRILSVARTLRQFSQERKPLKVFHSGLAVSLFRDHSTRTRFSFASAANLLGLSVQDLDESLTQIAHGETVRETAVMISFLTEIIGIRDDLYPGLGHSYMTELGEALDDAVAHGILEKRPGLINLQSELDHPTQSLADLLHLQDHFDGLDALKGKKLVVSWAYSPSYGKPMSVPQGVLGLLSRFGMDLTLAYPPGYELMPDIVAIAKKNAIASGGSFRVVQNMKEAFRGAHVVYPKSWAPFHILEERTRLFEKGALDALKDLEKKGLEYNQRFIDWECNEEMMRECQQKNSLYMHCLPADISGVSCIQGEVSKRVFERFRHSTYKQAAWKPWVIAALMICQKFRDPLQLLDALKDRKLPDHFS